VVTGAGNMDLTVAGSSPELMVVRNWTVAQGVALSHDDIRASRRVAVIGKNVARTLFPDDATPLGQSMRIGGTPFTVIGVLAGEGRTLTGEDLGDIVTVPISAIPVRMPKPRTVHYISVQAKDERQMAAAERELSDLLRDRHRITADKPDDFRVLNLADIAKQGALIATSLSIGLGAIGAISLLVGGIGIMNIMLVSVSERVREIGLRMAIGAQPRHILIQFLSESVVMCVVGGLAGVGLAMLGASVVNSISESFKMTISMSHVLTACGFASAVGLFFGYYPAHRASRMLPIECLRQD
jgi:putative ABC transport system permease protein